MSNYTLRESSGTEENTRDIVADPRDPLCTIKLLQFHINTNLPPNWKGLLFLHKAPEKVLSERMKMGISYVAYSDPKDSGDSTPKGKVGKNFLNLQNKKLARYCKFTNAERFSGRSSRRTGISKMAAAGVSTGEMCHAARHKSIAVNNVYQNRSAATAALRQGVFHVEKENTSSIADNTSAFIQKYTNLQNDLMIENFNRQLK